MMGAWDDNDLLISMLTGIISFVGMISGMIVGIRALYLLRKTGMLLRRRAFQFGVVALALGVLASVFLSLNRYPYGLHPRAILIYSPPILEGACAVFLARPRIDVLMGIIGAVAVYLAVMIRTIDWSILLPLLC